MSGDRSAPRYAHVMTTRRRWSAAEKQAIVAEVDVAGGSVSEVAGKHGVHTSLGGLTPAEFRARADEAQNQNGLSL